MLNVNDIATAFEVSPVAGNMDKKLLLLQSAKDYSGNLFLGFSLDKMVPVNFTFISPSKGVVNGKGTLICTRQISVCLSPPLSGIYRLVKNT